MKIFEIQLRSPDGETVYRSLVPEVHVKEKIDVLILDNNISDLGAFCFKEVGEISDRYIQSFPQQKIKAEE